MEGQEQNPERTASEMLRGAEFYPHEGTAQKEHDPLEKCTVKELREKLKALGGSPAGILEKSELIKEIRSLENR